LLDREDEFVRGIEGCGREWGVAPAQPDLERSN
jgi:hypothetical protein